MFNIVMFNKNIKRSIKYHKRIDKIHLMSAIDNKSNHYNYGTNKSLIDSLFLLNVVLNVTFNWYSGVEKNLSNYSLGQSNISLMG
jgi:hypothetical protein